MEGKTEKKCWNESHLDRPGVVLKVCLLMTPGPEPELAGWEIERQSAMDGSRTSVVRYYYEAGKVVLENIPNVIPGQITARAVLAEGKEIWDAYDFAIDLVRRS